MKKDVQKAVDALKDAERTFACVYRYIRTHMKYKLKRLAKRYWTALNLFEFAKGKSDEIEFSREDAARSDLDFLCEVFYAAWVAGGAYHS